MFKAIHEETTEKSRKTHWSKDFLENVPGSKIGGIYRRILGVASVKFNFN